MKTSARYAKIVEWSAEDNCYVGSAPGLILGDCHGDEQAVFEELCRIVEEAIALYEKNEKPPLQGNGGAAEVTVVHTPAKRLRNTK